MTIVGSLRGLAGKVAIVTGAAGGLGAASVRRLSDEGVSVVAMDTDAGRVQELTESLPGPAIWIRGDVSDEADVAHCVAAGAEKYGRVDFHHLNAGIPGGFAHLPDLDVADFDRVMAVNVRGVFLGLRAAFRQFRSQGSVGSIVVTASIGSLRASSDLLAYQTSKHAVVGLVRGAAVYGGPLGIRVNAVAPGIVPTELFAGAADALGGRNDMTRRASTVPLRRAGTGADVAGLTAFLFSDDAAYMTGDVVSVDGGAHVVSTVRPSGGAGVWDAEAFDRDFYGEDVGQ